MRKLSLLAIMLFATATFAQNKDTVGLHLPLVNDAIVYQKSFKVPGRSLGALYNSSREWFEARYNGLDSIKVQDGAAGHLTGSGWEVLTFKSPLGMQTPSRAGLKIDITSKEDGYTVIISNIVLGFQQEVGAKTQYFTPEDLLDRLSQKKFTKEVAANPAPFNKNRSKKALAALNVLVADVMASLNKTMTGK